MKRFSFTNTNNAEKLHLTITIEVRFIYQLRSANSSFIPLSTLAKLNIALKKGKRSCSHDILLKAPEQAKHNSTFDRYPVQEKLELVCSLHRDLATGQIIERKKAKLKLRENKSGHVYGSSRKELGVYKIRLDQIANDHGFEKIVVREEELTLHGFAGYLDCKITTNLESWDGNSDVESSDGDSDTSERLSSFSLDGTLSNSASPPDERNRSLPGSRRTSEVLNCLKEEEEVLENTSDVVTPPRNGVIFASIDENVRITETNQYLIVINQQFSFS
jgi:hypothetical protein